MKKEEKQLGKRKVKLWQYISDKSAVLLINLTGLFFLSVFLKLSSVSFVNIEIIWIVWLIVLAIWLICDYKRRKSFFEQLFLQLDELEQSYLIAEVIESSARLEDRLYREALRISNRSVIEKIHEIEDREKDYKEYIERWIHEVKLPLTGAKLICENEPGEQSRKMMLQMDKIEKMVEQVLFYARMEHAYQDYYIHKVNLREVVLASIAANKVYFIQKKIQIQLELTQEESMLVSTDEKWVEFLLTQIFSNAIKYAKEENPLVRIYVKNGNNQMSLIIEDNGVGIAKEDMPRIFDKGFTGKNGRIEKRSTGIGLYLCKGLCDKLGIGLQCESEEGIYTRMILTFPDSQFHELSEKER